MDKVNVLLSILFKIIFINIEYLIRLSNVVFYITTDCILFINKYHILQSQSNTSKIYIICYLLYLIKFNLVQFNISFNALSSVYYYYNYSYIYAYEIARILSCIDNNNDKNNNNVKVIKIL